MTYRIQLIGSPKTLVVHRNRLKLCYGEPQVKASKKQPTPVPQKKGSEAADPNPTSPLAPHRQSQHIRKSLRINKKLDHLEDIQPHQTNYQLGQEDHNIIVDPQCVTKIILLIDFVTFLVIL